MSETLPTAIWEGELSIGGRVLRVAVLDNGQRIINAEDFEQFMADMGPMTDDEVRQLARFVKGPSHE